MTYSEMRTAYTKSATLRHDVLLGSTHALTPEHFVDDLKVLEINGAGSRAAMEGVSWGECFGSAQRYYDQRYFQPEPMPPPQRVLSAPPGQEKGGSSFMSKLGGHGSGSGTGSGAGSKSGGGAGAGYGSSLSPGMAPPLQQTQSMTSFASLDSVGQASGKPKKKLGFLRF
jgi:syntaxin-binding protein 1